MTVEMSEAGSIEGIVAILKTHSVPFVVGVDGFHGSRKSNTAYKLGYELRANVVSIDDYLPSDCDAFSVDIVETKRLSERIKRLKTVGSVVVEGICLLAILERAGIISDHLIHIQELNLANSWKYREIVDDPERYQQYLANSKGLEVEVLKYHGKYRPWQKAEFVLTFRK